MESRRRKADMESRIKVLLIDEERTVRECLAEYLRTQPRLQVVGSIGIGTAMTVTAVRDAPDVVILTIDATDPDPFLCAGIIRRRHSRARLVVISRSPRDRLLDGALAIRAEAYLTRQEPLDNIVEAIERVTEGDTYFSPAVLARLVLSSAAGQWGGGDGSRLSSLSLVEAQLLRHIADGLDRRTIARRLHVHPKTVDRQIKRLMTKLDVHDRVALARFAIRERLIEA